MRWDVVWLSKKAPVASRRASENRNRELDTKRRLWVLKVSQAETTDDGE